MAGARRAGAFRRLTLRGRLLLVMSLVGAVAVIAVGVSSYVLQSRTLTRRAEEDTLTQTRRAADSLADDFGALADSGVLLAVDERVQSWLLADEGADDLTQMWTQAYQALSYLSSLQGDLAYAYVAKKDTGDTLYVGPSRAGRELGEAALLARNLQTAHLEGPTDNPLSGGDRVYLLYQPVFDIFEIDRALGVVCLAVPEERVRRACLRGGSAMALSLVDGAEEVLSGAGAPGEALNWFPSLSDDIAQAVDGGLLAARVSVDGTKWYMAGSVRRADMIGDYADTLAVTLLVIAGTMAACVAISAGMSRAVSAPYRELQERMVRVSQGDFESRIDLSGYGADYAATANGFNTMVEKVGQLMEDVRLKERQLADSELRMLRAQINPHFLYNTLDSIHWLAAMNGSRDISTMVKALADFYRVCLGNAREKIPLEEEIRHASSYLTIQKIRYADVLMSVIDCPADTLTLSVPAMILQPLLENAIYHGLKESGRPGTVTIAARREANQLALTVTDDGRGLAEAELARLNALLAAKEAPAHGVVNVHRRVRLICGPGWGLSFEAKAGGGLTARILLPVEMGEK